jgi:hypothetical protein
MSYIEIPFRRDVWGNGSIAPLILNKYIIRGEWSVSRLEHFTPGNVFPVSPLGRRLGDPTAGVDSI